ncbi:UNVERIFIED_CONTAM: hypothetical protein K2H54_007272 [Gekko kuhli]
MEAELLRRGSQWQRERRELLGNPGRAGSLRRKEREERPRRDTMSERKVLNKYYPPDFDPSTIPKLKLPRDRQYVVRLMAPLNMRCKTCGEYIYRGKKFNARKETVQKESYLGLPIFRFYIRCPRCLAEITFRTDPENAGYAVEHGATRNFQAEKLREEEEKRWQKAREDEEFSNPMKVWENRTKDCKTEMEVLENLQELKELSQRQANVDLESMLQHYQDREEEEQERLAAEEDEREMRAMLEEARARRLLKDSDDEDPAQAHAKALTKAKPPDTVLQEDSAESQAKKRKVGCWGRSIGKMTSKAALSGLVVARQRKLHPSTSSGTGSPNGLPCNTWVALFLGHEGCPPIALASWGGGASDQYTCKEQQVSELQTLRTAQAALGKGCLASSFIGAYQYSGELYPTEIRQTGMGFVSMQARIGAMVAPLIYMLRDSFPILPSLIFGAAPLLAGVVTCFLTETRHSPLLETIAEMEQRARKIQPLKEEEISLQQQATARSKDSV